LGIFIETRLAALRPTARTDISYSFGHREVTADVRGAGSASLPDSTDKAREDGERATHAKGLLKLDPPT